MWPSRAPDWQVVSLNQTRVPSYIPQLFNGIAFVAQSPGKNEVKEGRPLVGASGKLLQEICVTAGIDFSTCALLNVIGFNPPGNDFSIYCGMKAEVGGKDYEHKPIAPGVYLKPEWLPELARLGDELEALNPNLVVTLGREALWALTSLSGITKYRGAVMESNLVPGIKVLPTFHPAGIFRQYGNKVYLTLDLFKAKKEMQFPEIKTISRVMNIYPESVDEMYAWSKQAVSSDYANAHDCRLSVDIETRSSKGKTIIECIGFAFSPFDALVVPFYSELRPKNNYWPTEEEEAQAWEFVDWMLKTFHILGQNYMAYDTWVMYKEMGLKSLHFSGDTMVQHHSFQPEMKKGLGMLASIYCNVPAYKTLKPRGRKIDKRDE